MSTVSHAASVARTTRPVQDRQRLLLSNISWKQYEAMLKAFDGIHIRLTYDHGNLEIMPLSAEHERGKVAGRRLIETLCDELDMDIGGFGSTTHRRRNLKRGLEPDECYYIAHLSLVQGKLRLDFRKDPPPDLVLEVDVTRSSLDRLSIYAALGVAEVWRLKNNQLHVYVLTLDKTYEEVENSRTFPFVTVDDLNRFLALGLSQNESVMVRAFRAWIRDKVKKPRRKKNGNGTKQLS